MSKSFLRPFSKPKGYDERIRRELAGKSLAADAKPRSLIAARLRAEQLSVSLNDMLLEDRKRLRASNYPGPECFEPYEAEEYAAGALSPERLRHLEVCEGCRVLVSGVRPSEEQLAAFIDEIRQTEPGPDALRSRARGFWFDLAATSAAAVVIGGAGYFGLKSIGSVVADPALRSAAVSQVTRLISPVLVTVLLTTSLLLLAALLWRYGQEFLRASSGALTAGVVLGVFAVCIGGKNVVDSAAAMRAMLRLYQIQLTEEVALRRDPRNICGSGWDAGKLQVEPSSLIRVEASQPQPGLLRLRSHAQGLPGRIVGDMRLNGGQLYWDYADKKQPLDQILCGTVKSSSKDQFVLVDPELRSHTIKSADAGEPFEGSTIMALVDPSSQNAIKVYTLNWDGIEPLTPAFQSGKQSVF